MISYNMLHRRLMRCRISPKLVAGEKMKVLYRLQRRTEDSFGQKARSEARVDELSLLHNALIELSLGDSGYCTWPLRLLRFSILSSIRYQIVNPLLPILLSNEQGENETAGYVELKRKFHIGMIDPKAA